MQVKKARVRVSHHRRKSLEESGVLMIREHRREVRRLVPCVNEFEESKNVQHVAFVVWCEAEFFQGPGVDDRWETLFSEVVYRFIQTARRRNVRMFFSHNCFACASVEPDQTAPVVCRRTVTLISQYTRCMRSRRCGRRSHERGRGRPRTGSTTCPGRCRRRTAPHATAKRVNRGASIGRLGDVLGSTEPSDPTSAYCRPLRAFSTTRRCRAPRCATRSTLRGGRLAARRDRPPGS